MTNPIGLGTILLTRLGTKTRNRIRETNSLGPELELELHKLKLELQLELEIHKLTA